MTNDALPLSGWALVLGASSGFGGATAVELARRGMDVIGVHLDRRATLPQAERVAEAVRGAGRRAVFLNLNAADEGRRLEALEVVARETGGAGVRLLLHSLAFGTLRPLVDEQGGGATLAQLEMTSDVMGHSLVLWTQGLVARGLLGEGARVLAMTSDGARRVLPSYGPVAAAKAALEAHVRQLAVELAPRGIACNALCAGVTDTPALRKIPGAQAILDAARARNPSRRLTTPEDVARAVALLAHPCAAWITGNVIRVDGGEGIAA